VNALQKKGDKKSKKEKEDVDEKEKDVDQKDDKETKSSDEKSDKTKEDSLAVAEVCALCSIEFLLDTSFVICSVLYMLRNSSHIQTVEISLKFLNGISEQVYLHRISPRCRLNCNCRRSLA